MRKGHGGINIYDSADVTNPEDRPIVVRQDWRYIGIILAFVLAIVLVIALLLIVGYLFALSFDVNMMRLGWAILIVVFGAIGIVVISAALSAGKWLTTWADKSGLFDVMRYQSHVSRMNDKSDRYLDVMGRRMDKSFLSGAKNVTYSPHISKSYSGAMLPEAIEDEELEENDFIIPTLEELRRDNLIARSGNSILIGINYDEE